MSGTAYYDFNHFASYWKKWKSIIQSQGDRNRLREIFGEDAPENFDWTPPRGSACKYICRQWNLDMPNFNKNNIRTTFEQVFEP